MQPKWFQDNFGVKGATFSVSQSRLIDLGIDPANPIVTPSLIFPAGPELDSLATELLPFIEQKKLLIQPDRSIMVLKKESNPDGGRNWDIVKVSEFSPLEHWEIPEESASRPIPIDYRPSDIIGDTSLFEITIPFLENVPFKELAKILEDEGDLVSSLRASIKDVLKNCDSAVDPREIVRDIINPKVDLINRKFKSIVNTHSFRIAGAAVGTVVLAYTSMVNSGLSAAIATICGSGGIGLLGKEYSTFKEKMNLLKEDPHYFLWRCRKFNNR